MKKDNGNTGKAGKKGQSGGTSTESLELARTAPLAGGPAPDANVGLDGQCVMTETAEHTRPDSGDPCLDGRDGG